MSPALYRAGLPLAGLAACAVLDPRTDVGPILCPFRLITGLPCPFCGMTRALSSLLRARWQEAFAFHPFSPFVLAVLAAWIVVEGGRAAGLWKANPIADFCGRPAPWLAFAGVFGTYGIWRWWSILGN